MRRTVTLLWEWAIGIARERMRTRDGIPILDPSEAVGSPALLKDVRFSRASNVADLQNADPRDDYAPELSFKRK